MPSEPRQVPEHFLPSDARLLEEIRRRPGMSLRELAGRIWSGLPWSGGSGSDNATLRVRTFPIPCRVGSEGNRIERKTAAEYLRDRLEALVQVGALRHATRRRDEVDILASLAYVAPGAALRPEADPLPALAQGRRG